MHPSVLFGRTCLLDLNDEENLPRIEGLFHENGHGTGEVCLQGKVNGWETWNHPSDERLVFRYARASTQTWIYTVHRTRLITMESRLECHGYEPRSLAWLGRTRHH